MKGPLEQALVDIVEDLDARDVSYALVGGLATSLRGKVRISIQRDAIDWDYCIRIAEQLEQAVDIDLANRIRKLRQD